MKFIFYKCANQHFLHIILFNFGLCLNFWSFKFDVFFMKVVLTPKGPNHIFFGNIAIFGSSLWMEFLIFPTTCRHSFSIRPKKFHNFWLQGKKVILWYVIFRVVHVAYIAQFFKIICFRTIKLEIIFLDLNIQGKSFNRFILINKMKLWSVLDCEQL